MRKSKPKNLSRIFTITCLFALILGTFVSTTAQQPFRSEEIVTLLKKGVEQAEIKKQIEKYRVRFVLTPEKVRELIRAGATDELLDAIEKNQFEELAITSPSPDASVSAIATVYGKSQRFNGRSLWLFAQREGLTVWWPQGGEVQVDASGAFMQSVFLGQQQDVGFKFNIVAQWVDESVNRDLVNYMRRAEETGKYPGILLPPGSPVTQVKVRKSTH
jgi:hypothetical protein